LPEAQNGSDFALFYVWPVIAVFTKLGRLLVRINAADIAKLKEPRAF
jgi:hypothetical protein